MNQLVFQNNDQIVTSSRNVARDFGKRHYHVVRDCEEVIKGLPKNGDTQKMFYETTYVHEQNKQVYKEFLMNRDGFTLLVMGFTGKEATKFKMQYINAFNDMEKELSQPNNTKLLLQTALNHEEKIETIQSDVNYLKDNMRIDGRQEQIIRKRANAVVVEALGGKSSQAYKNMAFKAFSAFWRDFKNHFEIPRYGDLPKNKFKEGLRFIGMWQPSTSLKIDIDNENRQQSMEGVI